MLNLSRFGASKLMNELNFNLRFNLSLATSKEFFIYFRVPLLDFYQIHLIFYISLQKFYQDYPFPNQSLINSYTFLLSFHSLPHRSWLNDGEISTVLSFPCLWFLIFCNEHEMF